MTKRRTRGMVRVPTVTALLAIATGLVLVATGSMGVAFAGILLLVAGAVELALDFEQTVVPPRRPIAPPVPAATRRPVRPPEDYEELGAA